VFGGSVESVSIGDLLNLIGFAGEGDMAQVLAVGFSRDLSA
jgi:hypothetical protein